MADQLSATEQLIQQLRRPQQDKTQDVIRALTAFTSPETQKQVLATMPQQSAFSPEEQRLAKAAEFENKRLKMAASLSGDKQSQKDLDSIEKYGRIMKGLERGATRLGKTWDAHAQINRLENYIKDIESNKITFDDVTNADFSAAFSGLITGKSPGIELIRETKYSHLGGKLNQMYQFMTGEPQESLSPVMYEEVKNMLSGLKKAVSTQLSNEQAHLWNVYKGRLERNPNLYNTYQKMVSNFVNFDEQGNAVPFGEEFDLKAAKQESGEKKFPIKLYKDGSMVTVSNEGEYAEATSEGWGE